MSHDTNNPDMLTNDPIDNSDLEAMPDVVVISGMSGAGRTQAMHVFEDLGYFCIDNLPSSLIEDVLQLKELPAHNKGKARVAIVCDARNRSYFNDLPHQMQKLKASGVRYRLIFLDAADDKLIARYKASRRRHPMCEEGMSIVQGIQRERSMLYTLRESAHNVIDTTDMLPQQLRSTIRGIFATGQDLEGLNVSVYSFGFKHGAALDADIVIDVRFLPNPYYEPTLRTLTGLDAPVRDFVMHKSVTEDFLHKWKSLLDTLMPGYVSEGKQQLAIAVGCTGGQHRSVALALATGDYLQSCGYRVSVAHRDLKLAGK